MVSINLPMMTLLLALSAGQSLLRLACVLVGRSKTIRCSLRLQYLQRLNSYVCTPMWHHKALSPSYGCTVGVVYTLLIALGCVNLDPTPRRRSYVGSGRPSVRAHSNGCCDHGSLFAGSFDCCFVPLFVFLVSLRHRRCSRASGLLLVPPPTLRVALRTRCGVLRIRRWLVRMRPCVVLRR